MELFRAAAAVGVAAVLLAWAGSVRPAADPPSSGRWWRGNTHTHTLWSDGDSAPEAAVDWYVRHGYDFLVVSDHNILAEGELWRTLGEGPRQARPSQVAELQLRFGAGAVELRRRADGREEMRLQTLAELRARFERPGRFLLVTGEEISDTFAGRPIHHNALNLVQRIDPPGGATVRELMRRTLALIEAEGRRSGRPVLGHLNHPNYEWGVSADDLAAVVEERFFEVYNGHRLVRNEGDATHPATEAIWDHALTARLAVRGGPPLYALATDDAHDFLQKPWVSNPGRGWIVVRAPELSAAAILAAMTSGDFYASSGVALRDVRAGGASLTVEVEPRPGDEYTIRFLGTRRRAGTSLAELAVGEVLAESRGPAATYRFRGDELYVRATVVSSRPHPNGYSPGDLETAWVQPVVAPAPEAPGEPADMERPRALAAPALVGLVLAVLAGAALRQGVAVAGGAGAAAILGLALVAGAAALHRPLGGSGLGVGAAVLAPAARLLGPAGAAWSALIGVLLAETAARRLTARRRDAPPERRGFLRLLEGGARAGLAALAATAVLLAFPGAAAPAAADAALALAAAGAAAALVAVAAAFDLAVAALRREGHEWSLRRALPPALLPTLVEAAGFLVGAALLPVVDRLGAPIAGALLAALALLASEAARQAHLHGRSERQAEELRQVGRAAQRMVAGGQPLRTIAEQIRVECHNLVPFVWYEFERGEARWSAGPDGVLSEGAARPEPVPPPLPGVHRRGTWEVVERDLRVEGESLARLRLWCDPRRVEPGARQLLDELLPQMAASVHRALLDREARQDPLTGVGSRRVLDERLQAAFHRACDEGTAMAVLICDLDHFKRINDTCGHDAGDRALVAVARVLDAQRREQDLLCRYGGEEFTVLLEASDGQTALRLAERLRQAVAALDLEVGGRRLPLSLSAGAASFPEVHIKTAAELVLLADAALYRAKQAGRNRVYLNRGGGRFLDPGGAQLAEADARPPTPPQIFA